MDFDYKANTVSVGYSDIAQLTARGPQIKDGKWDGIGYSNIDFGIDDDYRAHIVTNAPEGWTPPSHYEKCFECVTWLDIIDDEKVTLKMYGFKVAHVYVVPHSRTMLIHATEAENVEITIK